jgi:hypothetical protein
MPRAATSRLEAYPTTSLTGIFCLFSLPQNSRGCLLKYFSRISFESDLFFLATTRGLPPSTRPRLFSGRIVFQSSFVLMQSLSNLSSTSRHSEDVVSASLDSDDAII